MLQIQHVLATTMTALVTGNPAAGMPKLNV
jgi:hypothetical protein